MTWTDYWIMDTRTDELVFACFSIEDAYQYILAEIKKADDVTAEAIMNYWRVRRHVWKDLEDFKGGKDEQ